jgi:hypothetical protein
MCKSTIHAVTQKPVACKGVFKIMALVHVVHLHLFNNIMGTVMTIELSVKSFKAGQNYEFGPSFIIFLLRVLLVRHVSKCVLKVG